MEIQVSPLQEVYPQAMPNPVYQGSLSFPYHHYHYVCRACEEVCPVDAILITDPGDIDSDSPSKAAPEKEAETEATVATSQPASSMSQMPVTPVMQQRPHAYAGYKQNSYCVKCGKYTFHWHGSSPNNPDLYPNYECKDCGFIRKIKIS